MPDKPTVIYILTVAPSRYLNQPNNIVLVQKSRNFVNVKWRACPYDNPTSFKITFQGDDGETLKCVSTTYSCSET